MISPTPDQTADLLIIGAGFSGTALSVQLHRHSTTKKVTLVDPNPPGDFGPAYRTDCRLHQLNTPAKGMSLFPGEPLHFANWLTTRDATLGAESFAERRLYRAYLTELSRETTEVERLTDAVVRLDHQGEAWQATLESGAKVAAKQVVLALGSVPATDLEALRPLRGHPCYVPDLWGSQQSALPTDVSSVAIVGSGLTAVDAVLAFEGMGIEPTFTMISRHGLLPQRHGPRSPGEAKAPAPSASLRKLLHDFLAATYVCDYRNLIDAMRPNMADYWRALPLDQKAKFVSRVRVYWEAHRHRLPPEVATRVDAVQKSGRLTLQKGHIQSAKPVSGGVEVVVDGQMQRFDLLINCSGPGLLSRCNSPLLQQLLREGFATTDPLGLGLRCDADGQLTGQPGLYGLGILRRGELYESTAVRELALQAEALSGLLG